MRLTRSQKWATGALGYVAAGVAVYLWRATKYPMPRGSAALREVLFWPHRLWLEVEGAARVRAYQRLNT